MRMTCLGSRARIGALGALVPLPHVAATFAPNAGGGAPRGGPDQ